MHHSPLFPPGQPCASSAYSARPRGPSKSNFGTGFGEKVAVSIFSLSLSLSLGCAFIFWPFFAKQSADGGCLESRPEGGIGCGFCTFLTGHLFYSAIPFLPELVVKSAVNKKT